MVLENSEGLMVAAGASSPTGGVVVVRLVPTAMVEGAGTGVIRLGVCEGWVLKMG